MLSITDVMKDLGIDPVPALVGFIWKEKLEATDGARIAAFLSAVREANALLLTKDEAWERLRPLVKPGSDGEFKALIASYRGGILMRGWGEGETASAEKLDAGAGGSRRCRAHGQGHSF